MIKPDYRPPGGSEPIDWPRPMYAPSPMTGARMVRWRSRCTAVTSNSLVAGSMTPRSQPRGNCAAEIEFPPITAKRLPAGLPSRSARTPVGQIPTPIVKFEQMASFAHASASPPHCPGAQSPAPDRGAERTRRSSSMPPLSSLQSVDARFAEHLEKASMNGQPIEC